MKSKFIYLLIIAVTISSSVKCQKEDLGEIILCQEIELGCLILGREIGGEHVIRNNTEYQDLLTERSPYSSCSSYELPNIDFDQFTLLGYVSSIGGCSFPSITRELIKKDDTHYAFNIDLIQHGYCELNIVIDFWCLIPKIKSNATVIFKKVETVEPN